MSRQLDQVVAEAAAKNLSFALALESLTDLELEARNRQGKVYGTIQESPGGNVIERTNCKQSAD